MKNLKRILSLALASVMVMGMMVVGASAATFTDDEDIVNDAAVDTMVALNIISGMDDGSFNPTGKVTRAQMAKMLTFALNGGVDPQIGKPTTPTFADSANHWAVEYIEYCTNLGIIGGKGVGVFDPEGNVTAAEAAKMILVALGFDPDIFELVGANWSTNTMRLAQTLRIGANPLTASTLNLFDGLGTIPANTELTRDQAAQLIYNGIQSNTVVMSLSGVTSGSNTGLLGDTTGNRPQYTWSITGPSLLTDKFKATVAEGVLVGADYTKATNSSAAYWNYDVKAYNADGVLVNTADSYTFDKDVSDAFMQTVRVIYRTERGNRTTVLAITTVGNDVVSETAWGDLNINENRNTVDGYALGIASVNGEGVETAYTTANLPVYSFLNTTAGTLGAASYKDYDSAKLVDSNGDGRLDCIVVTPVTVAQVATVRPTYIQIRGLATNVLLEKNVVAEGLNAGDFVTYTQNPETEVYTVEKAETVTGVLTATMDATQTRPNQIQVGGTWYTVIENYNSGANLKGMVGAEVELVLAAGYVVNGQRITEASNTSDAVMVVAKAGATTQTSNNIYVDANAVYLEVKILKDDNTTENLKVTKVGSDAVSTSNITTGKLYTYAADPEANGCVILTEYAPYVATDQPTPQSPVFDDKLENSFTVNSGLISSNAKSFRIADDATFFVLAGNKFAAVKGADMNKWYKQGGYTAGTNSAVYADRASNGFVYAQTGAIVLSKETAIPGATGSTQFFGYVTANAYYTTGADGTHYIAVPVWNGSENVTVLAKTIAGEDDNTTTATQGDETNFTTGTLVSYLDNNDGTASALATLPVSAAKDAVTAWDNSSVIKFFTAGSGAELTVDDKTVILFINGADRAGVENGNIILADYVDPYDTTEGLYANVYYVKTSAATQPNANDHVDVLVLDTNNRIAKNATESVIVGATKDPAPHTHNFVADKTAADATCTTPGQKATYKCDEDNCPNKETRWLDNKGETEVKDGNDVIAATGHNVTTWAACTDSSDSEHNGTHHSGTCGTCNETVYEAHTFGENAQSGDECTATGCTATKD